MASGRRLTAIMLTDMVGSTELAQRDEAGALVLIEDQERIARGAVAAHRGRWIKSTGDGLLAEFPSALDAVECAVEFLRRVHERNSDPAITPLRVRVGLHLGDVQGRDGDIFGDAVNVTARVEAAAGAGEVCLSEPLYGQVHRKLPYRFEPLGARPLKGIAEPMPLYRVQLPWSASSAPVPGTATPRVAVLPLANISPDPKDEYFADGLTEELISVLSRIPALRVIARTSVMPYKATTKALPQIGSELGVTSILEGSVRKAGDRLRISLQLIDVASQAPIWSERYDRQLSDVFAIQSEVAEQTANSVRIELSDRAKEYLHRPPTTSLPAYDLYLKALAQDDGLQPEKFTESVALLEAAIERDPDFALAHALLGHRYVQGAGDFLTHREGFARARTYVTRALALNPDLSEAHAARGNLAMQEEHDWVTARTEFERAIALNPSNALARVSYATLLRVLGRWPESEAQLEAAAEVSPGWWVPRWLLVDAALSARDPTLAERRARSLPSPDPNPALTRLAFAVMHALRGQAEEARRELDRAGTGSEVFFRFGRAIVLAKLGDPSAARQLLAEIDGDRRPGFVPSDYLPALCALVGEKERALALIEEGVRTGESPLWLRHMNPAFDTIRDDPRFVAALRSLGLPEEAIARTPRSTAKEPTTP